MEAFVVSWAAIDLWAGVFKFTPFNQRDESCLKLM